MGKVPECNSIPKSTTLCEGSPGSSSGKQDAYSQCKTPNLLNVIIVVFELIRGPMIEMRVD